MKIDIKTYNEVIAEYLNKRFPGKCEESKEDKGTNQRTLYKFLDIEQKELFSIDMESPLFKIKKDGYEIIEHNTGRTIKKVEVFEF